jgi:hypothetical protein
MSVHEELFVRLLQCSLVRHKVQFWDHIVPTFSFMPFLM